MELKLLIVDDTEEILGVIEDLLSEGFTQVMFASSVDEAIKKLDSNKFICMILDIQLGEKNGSEVVRYLQSNPNNQNSKMPIVLISGFINQDFIEKNKNRFAGILSKPFDEKELRKIVSDILFKSYPEL
jgi:CheY-like chemotaxis protein